MQRRAFLPQAAVTLAAHAGAAAAGWPEWRNCQPAIEYRRLALPAPLKARSWVLRDRRTAAVNSEMTGVEMVRQNRSLVLAPRMMWHYLLHQDWRAEARCRLKPALQSGPVQEQA
jgi:DNA-binding transcriptional LysR family regulator